MKPCCEHPDWRHTPNCVDCGCTGEAIHPTQWRRQLDEGSWARDLLRAAERSLEAAHKAEAARLELDEALERSHTSGAGLAQLRAILERAGISLTRGGVFYAIQKVRERRAPTRTRKARPQRG